MRSETFQFTSKNLIRNLVNIARVNMDDHAEIISINFNGPVREFTAQQWADLTEKIKSIQNEYKQEIESKTTTDLVGIAETPQKLGMMQAIKFVFSGGGGLSGALERLEKVGDMAMPEMNEKEKAASKALLKNLKDLTSNGKPRPDGRRNIG